MIKRDREEEQGNGEKNCEEEKHAKKRHICVVTKSKDLSLAPDLALKLLVIFLQAKLNVQEDRINLQEHRINQLETINSLLKSQIHFNPDISVSDDSNEQEGYVCDYCDFRTTNQDKINFCHSCTNAICKKCRGRKITLTDNRQQEKKIYFCYSIQCYDQYNKAIKK